VNRRLRGVVLAVLTAVLFSACQATVKVGVRENSNGSGRITVAVTLDPAASRAVGDLAQTLKSTELPGGGWVVTRARSPGRSGPSTVIEASRSFRTPAQAQGILAQIAGTPSSDVFGGLRLSHTRGFFVTRTRLAGRVDLRCRLECFDDPQLVRALDGRSLTALASILQRDNGLNLQRIFRFNLIASLPGSVTTTNAASRAGQMLGWSLPLGGTRVVLASTEAYNRGHIVVIVIGGVVVILVIVVVVTVILRRHRRRWRHSAATQSQKADAGPS
jgi:hypothetical protein